MKEYNSSTEVFLGRINRTAPHLERQRRMSYDFRPGSRRSSAHIRANKQYCDILGRKYCIVCSEETMRETSYVQSLTEAESIIARSAIQSRMSLTAQSRVRPDFSVERQREASFQEDGRVDHLVNSIFPLMYRALSLRTAGDRSTWPTEDLRESTESTESDFERQETRIPASPCSLDSIVDDKEIAAKTTKCDDNLQEIVNADTSFAVSDSFAEDKAVSLNGQHGIDTTDLVAKEGFGFNEEADDNESRKSEDVGSELETLSLNHTRTGLRRQKSGRTYQELVRRSSVVGRTIREQTNEKIRFHVKGWKCTDYLQRQRMQKETTEQGLTTVEEAESDRVVDGAILPTLTLEKLKMPRYTQSLLPMEPVMCGFKYIRNRWIDEAVFRNNNFAIKLNSNRTCK